MLHLITGESIIGTVNVEEIKYITIIEKCHHRPNYVFLIVLKTTEIINVYHFDRDGAENEINQLIEESK